MPTACARHKLEGYELNGCLQTSVLGFLPFCHPEVSPKGLPVASHLAKILNNFSVHCETFILAAYKPCIQVENKDPSAAPQDDKIGRGVEPVSTFALRSSENKDPSASPQDDKPGRGVEPISATAFRLCEAPATAACFGGGR